MIVYPLANWEAVTVRWLERLVPALAIGVVGVLVVLGIASRM